MEWGAGSRAGLPGSLGSLLLRQTAASSRLRPGSGDLSSSLLLGTREGSGVPSGCRELQAESLARQAEQLLTEPPGEASQEEAPDQAKLDTLGALGPGLGAGTLS